MGFHRSHASLRAFTLSVLVCQIAAFVFTTRSTSSDTFPFLIPTENTRRVYENTGVKRSKSLLFSTPPKRVARRDLKKRTRRKRDGQSKTPKVEETAQVNKINIETRSLVRSKSIEAGEDYWIDEVELEKFSQREEAVKNRRAMEGEIPKEKLQQEVVAPYKQNWIGLLSVGIVVLAAVIKEFPDLLNSPMIPIPDL